MRARTSVGGLGRLFRRGRQASAAAAGEGGSFGLVVEAGLVYGAFRRRLQRGGQSVSHYHTPSRELMAHTMTLLTQVRVRRVSVDLQ